MKRPFLVDIFRSHYCKIVFVIFAFLVLMFTPRKIFYSYYIILGVAFVLVTSLTATCFVRNVKERILSAKASGASVVGIISVVFGFGALQACTIGAPVCGVSLGAGIAALVFPGVAFGFAEKYGIWIVIVSIVIQVVALYYMKCFKSVKVGKKCGK